VYVVAVTFDIQLGRMSDFLPLMREQVRNSLKQEPGRRRFDVSLSEDERQYSFTSYIQTRRLLRRIWILHRARDDLAVPRSTIPLSRLRVTTVCWARWITVSCVSG